MQTKKLNPFLYLLIGLAFLGIFLLVAIRSGQALIFPVGIALWAAIVIVFAILGVG